MTTPGYVSKTDLVAALIRELVITGELEPGEQLRQRDLAQRFHVSQTPVREAMRRLESEGLLTCDTHRGFTVVAPDVGRVEENFQIRAATVKPRWVSQVSSPSDSSRRIASRTGVWLT